MNKEKIKQLSEEYKLSPAVPEKIPKSTYMPVFLAFSVVLFFWGFITSLIISGVGLVLTGVAVFGWITDMNNE